MRKKRKTKKKVGFLLVILPLILMVLVGLWFWKAPSPVTSKAITHDTVTKSVEQKQPSGKVDSKSETKPKQQNEKPNQTPEKIDGRTVFLTFDDGPSPHFNQFIDTLTNEKVPATFFFIGNNLQHANKDALARLKNSPFRVGLHSYTHDAKLLYRKENPTFLPEMKKLSKEIQSLTGISTKLIRAPYGSTYLTDAAYQKVKREGYHVLDWNIDSNDWRYKDNSTHVVQSVLSQAKTLKSQNIPLIILFHERPNTLKALPTIIQELKKQGYHFKAFDASTPYYHNFKEH